jgi:NSS family neurotransmitter:Na+ symporter
VKEDRFSRVGFILAAAGSAVGIGNIWRFPYVAGEYGGGAFALVYIGAILFAALPLLIGEILIGKITRKEPVSAFEDLAPADKKYWRFAGFQIISSFIILCFYTVVIGWVLAYFVHSFFSLPESSQEAKELFTSFIAYDVSAQIFYHAIAVLITGAAVLGGIKRGVERANKIMTPALFIMLLFLLSYAATLPSFGKAVSFMFVPDFSKLATDAVLVAFGQSFFSASVGMAVMIAYASATQSGLKVCRSAALIVMIDTLVAFIAGIVAFSFLFYENMPSAQGTGLAFISMPAAFYDFGVFGRFLAAAFFAALGFAGITSSISILEPTVSYFIHRHRWSRAKATWLLLLVAYLIGVLTLLSVTDGFKFVRINDMSLFDFLDFSTSAFLLPIGALLVAIFLGFAVDRGRIASELKGEGLSRGAIKFWFFLIRFVAPVATIAAIAVKLSDLA